MNRVGEQNISNQGCLMTIIAYRKAVDMDIQFTNGCIVRGKTYFNFKNGKISNPLHPSVYGVGYVGVGIYSETTHPKTYNKWCRMLQRCYCPKYHKNSPTYRGCSVHPDWYNFQNFAKWFEENYVEGYDLDKDILFKGNKIYSPKTCCFVPQEVNMLFTKCTSKRGKYPIGVSKARNKYQATLSSGNELIYLGVYDTPELAFKAYKRAKERDIKDVAKLCKGSISDEAYQALMSYKVEIND